MNLNYFLTTLPTWLLALFVLGIWTLYAITLQIFVRWKFGNATLKKNNELAGYKFGVQGVAYAVLLAFVVVLVWENYRDVELAVQKEARATIDLFKIAQALPEEYKKGISQSIVEYAESVFSLEWPTMSLQGTPSRETSHALNNLTTDIIHIVPTTNQELALYQQSLDLLRQINDSRSQRLISADGSVSPNMWIILVAGALITIGYPSFFGSDNFYFQLMMTITLAMTIALTLFMILSLDFPFSGGFSISRKPFQELHENIWEAP